MEDRSRDREPLAHAAGKTAHAIVRAIRKPDFLEDGGGNSVGGVCESWMFSHTVPTVFTANARVPVVPAFCAMAVP